MTSTTPTGGGPAAAPAQPRPPATDGGPTPSAPGLPPGYRFEQLSPARLRDILDLDTWAFPSGVSVDDMLRHPDPFSWERAVGVESERPDPQAVPADGAVPTRRDLVGMHSSYPFGRFPVPGGTLPVAGLTWVGVHPGHRRRGLLRAMIARHFADCAARGEAVSALFAAEATIYGRFGYGIAARDLHLTVPRGAALREVPGAARHTVWIEHADEAAHGDLVAQLHEGAGADPAGIGAAAGLNRPGWVGRETAPLRARHWSDPAELRDGFESRRIAIVALDGEPRGYATFRRKIGWEQGEPRGTVAVGECVARDAAAARALWGVLTDLDLTTQVDVGGLPVDDPITGLLANPRASKPTLGDNVWVRLVDVGRALAGRRYASDLDVVVHVTDALLPQNTGRWQVRATAFEPATADRTEAAADLSLDVQALGAAYLGGVSIASMAGVGLVTEHRPGALRQASAAFGWPIAPGCNWIF